MTCDHCGSDHDDLGECLCPRCKALCRAAYDAEDDYDANPTATNKERKRAALAAFRAVNIYRRVL